MKRLAFVCLVLLPLTALGQSSESFGVYDDASGNTRDLTERGSLLEDRPSLLPRFGHGIEGWSNNKVADRKAPTGLDSTTDLSIVIVARFNQSSQVRTFVQHQGNGNSTIHFEISSLSGSVRLFYRHTNADASLFQCNGPTGSNGMQRFWIRRSIVDQEVRVSLNGVEASCPWNPATQTPDASMNGAFTVGNSVIGGSQSLASSHQVFEIRVWHSDVPTATLDAILDPDGDFAATLEGSEDAAYFFEPVTIVTPAPPGPVPVDLAEGLDEFVESLGFKTAESKTFFSFAAAAMIAVTAGVTMRQMAPGRAKNWVIAGSMMGFTGFLVLVGFLQFWQYLLALVIGVFVVRGGTLTQARNTYQEVQALLDPNRSVPSGFMGSSDGAVPISDARGSLVDQLDEEITATDQEG